LNGYLDRLRLFHSRPAGAARRGPETPWLNDAKNLTNLMITWHWDKTAAAFSTRRTTTEKLFARAKGSVRRGATGGNSVAARDLVRLYMRTKDANTRHGQKQFAAFAGR